MDVGRDGSVVLDSERNARMLLNRARYKGPGAGLYAEALDGGAVANLEASADAALALAEAGERGEIEVPRAFWPVVDEAWHRLLAEAAGKRDAAKGAATALTPIAQAVEVLLAAGDARVLKVDCNPLPPDGALENAVALLAARYEQLYEGPVAFEAIDQFARVMRAVGRKYVGDDGTRDWYAELTAFVLAAQRADGSWGDGVTDTAHALRFLAGARTPVLVQKLAYDVQRGPVGRQPGAWNNRPRDVARLAAWFGRERGTRVDWRVVRADAPLEDWLEAPMLLISGNRQLDLPGETKRKLGEYVRRGGVVVGRPDCEDVEFVASFRRLGRELFPGRDFRELPASHDFFVRLATADKRRGMEVFGLGDGTRELMVLLPRDPVEAWAGNASRRGADLLAGWLRGPAALRKDEWAARRGAPGLMAEQTIAAAKAAAGASREAWPERGPLPERVALAELHAVALQPPPPPPPLKGVTLAMVSSGGGSFDPAAGDPFESLRGALRRRDTQLTVDAVALGQWTLQRYDVAWASGRRLLTMSALQRMEVRRFLETGGRLPVDVSDVPRSAGAVEGQFVSMFDAPRMEFGAAGADDKEIPVSAAEGLRVGRVEGRTAVALTADAGKAQAVLEALLAVRAK
jgi:hypothetical protein